MLELNNRISIEPLVSSKIQVTLGILSCELKVQESTTSLIELINNKANEKSQSLKVEEISQQKNIKFAREAYKKLGKDPARYRLSAEALLRRICSGKGIYFINNVIDCLNLVSFSTGYSIGGYNLKKIEGKIALSVGTSTDQYEGIGRGLLNIESLPVLRDEKGAFGNPTSDSVRTSASQEMEEFLMVFFAFFDDSDLDKALETSKELFETYCSAKNFNILKVKSI